LLAQGPSCSFGEHFSTAGVSDNLLIVRSSTWVTVAALAEMEKFLASFHPESVAAHAGVRMLERQAQQLPTTIETVMQRAQPRMLKPFALDR